MMIKHKPYCNVDKVVKFYSEKDKVEIKYVCTTELDNRGLVYDIFYRADGSEHPEFGNRYFGITYDHKNRLWIGNADRVEGLTFDTISGIYSRHVHDLIPAGRVMLDGGRCYTRIVGDATYELITYIVRDGEFIEKASVND